MNKKHPSQKPKHLTNNSSKNYQLILLNDDVNSFDHVIQSLVSICDFDYERAEQCTLLTHLKGQYPILSGSKDFLEEIQSELFSKNINSKIIAK